MFPSHFCISQVKLGSFPSKKLTSFLFLVLPISFFYSNLLSVKYTFRVSLKCILQYLFLSFHTPVFCTASAGEPTHHSAAPCTAYHSRWASVIRLEYSQHAASSCDLPICHTTSLRKGFKVDSVQQADASLWKIQISHLLSSITWPEDTSWMASNYTADLFINSPW